MRRNEGLFCELVATEQVEVTGFGCDFGGLAYSRNR